MLPLQGYTADYDPQSVLKDALFSQTPDDWFEHYFKFEDMSDPRQQELTRKIHAKFTVDQIYIRILHQRKITAVASLAIENGYSLLHNVVVDPTLRGKGLGKQLCRAALLKSVDCGATHMYLQVMHNNPVAINLYSKLGFKKQYTYYYVMNHADEFRKNVEN